LKSFERETASEFSSDESSVPPENWPSEGAIELANVEASYG
jgi:hypothetical protein